MQKLQKPLLGMLLSLLIAPAFAQDNSDVIDADAMNDLQAMGAYLRTLKDFRVQVSARSEVVLEDGQKLQYDSEVDMLARKPNGLRISDVSDSYERMYFYDGKNFTLLGKRTNMYASIEAPDSIGKLVDQLQDELGLVVPLADLFRWGTDDETIAAITAAMDAGPAGINGITCEQYAFRQENIDWQLWIQKGAYPLPCKIVITNKEDEARPQYSAVYEWNLAPSYSDEAFVFEKPEGAIRVVLENLTAINNAESK